MLQGADEAPGGPEAGTAAFVHEAVGALRGQRPDEAARSLEACLEREELDDASHALVYASLGIALQQLGNIEGALEAFDRAHYLQPDNPQILYNYGLALESAGRNREARRRYLAALKLDEEYDRPRERLQALPGGEAAPPALERVSARRGVLPPPPDLPGADIRARPSPPPPPVPVPTKRPPRPEPSIPIPDDAPLALQREDLTPVEAAAAPDWEEELRPGFVEVGRSALQLWGEQPLVWLLMLAVPNAIAAFFAPQAPQLGWQAGLVWLAALVAGMAPVLHAMANQWLYEHPFEERRLGFGRWLRGTLLALFYLLLTAAPVTLAVTFRTRLPADAVLLASLLVTAPFHALLAPSLVMVSTKRVGIWKALGTAFRLAGKRTWWHLALMILLGGVLGGALGLCAWAFVATLRGAGDVTLRTSQVAGLCIGESIWLALVTACGMDATGVGRDDREAGSVELRA